MTIVFAWIITVVVLVLLVTFVLDVLSLRFLPTEERPRTATYDRLGRCIGVMENPDYRENPSAEDHGDD